MSDETRITTTEAVEQFMSNLFGDESVVRVHAAVGRYYVKIDRGAMTRTERRALTSAFGWWELLVAPDSADDRTMTLVLPSDETSVVDMIGPC